ncbi:MAG: right-handed parallel beta-helix repeat-containing protein [Gemmataceae bacterium]|nr:right-handed parallel beta-helix repeat-containing protein [Gemmataceae bacterium]
MSRWMRRLFARPTRTHKIRNPRLRLLSLEEKVVPTVFTVNTAVDENDGIGVGLVSLRDALNAAAIDGAVPHTINFDTTTFGAATTITLTNGQLVAGLGGVTINGPGASLLTIKQTTANSRVLKIDNGNTGTADTYTINGLTFTGGNVTTTTVSDRGAGIGVGSEDVTITNCVINANTMTTGAGGGIACYESSALTVLKITNSSVTNNSAAGNTGGVRFTTNNTGTITNSLVTGNAAGATGGGIYAYRSASITLGNSTISNNRTNTSGAGVRLTGGSGAPVNASISNTSITGNTAATIGGALYSFDNPGTVVISGCLVANNRATGLGSDGGGLRFNGANSAAGTVRVENTTIAGNSAGEYGGGFSLGASYAGNVTISFSTIANNIAEINGGGINRSGVNAGTTNVTIENTIVANNTSLAYPDIILPVGTGVTVNNSVVGNSNGLVITAGTGLVATPGSFIPLGILSNNGGPTLTMLPAPFGILSNVGSATTITTDQRGNPRTAGSAPDVGAAENSGTEPVAVLAAPLALVDRPGATSYSVTLTYYDAVNVKVASIGTSNITVTGGATVSSFSASSGVDAKTITVTYTITPPGGSWDKSDNGNFTIALANNVENSGGTKIAGATIGTLSVQVGDIFTVTNTAASGAGSLAKAVTDAQAGTVGLADLIRFDPTVFASAQTITLSAALAITDNLVIEGPGRDLLTVRQAGTDRLFLISDGSTTKYSNIVMSGMTLRDGAPSSGSGGAIQISTEYLTIRDMRITNNTSTTHGGAIATIATGSGAQGSKVLVFNSELSKNTAGLVIPTPTNAHGGAYSTGASNSLNNLAMFKDCVLTGNTAGGKGGAIYGLNAGFAIENCQISGNLAAGSSGGGGVMTYGVSRTFSIVNSTIANNRTTNASASGAGVLITGGASSSGFGGFATITSSTIVGNTAASGKTAGIVRTGPNGVVTVVSSLIANNTDGQPFPTAPDLNGVVNFLNSAVANSAASVVTELGTPGSSIIGAPNPILTTPLYDFGGGRLGIATIPDYTLGTPNVARDKGYFTGLTFDQRGTGYPRVVGTTDMGALEFALGTPVATVSTFGTISAPDPDYQFTVSYYDETGIQASSIDGDEILVTGPGGFSQLASLVGVGSGTTKYDQVYKVNAPGGFWDVGENGDYTVTLLGGKATDTGAAAVPQTVFGTFTIFVPPALKVTTTADSGVGSLRQVFSDANKVAGATTITFDPAVFATPQTITLTTGQIVVSNPSGVTVNGPGNVAISGNGANRIFFVNDNDSANTMTFNVTGVTLRDARTWNTDDNGAAVLSVGENLVFTNVNILNNTGSGDGGAIALSGGKFTWTDGTASGNSAVGPLSDGGFLFATTADISMIRCTISGNSAIDGGGGVYAVTSSTVTLDSCTVSGNSTGAAATAYGGGLYFGTLTNATLTNSTVSSNIAGESGGGIRYRNGTLTLNNSTVANNVARNHSGSVVLGGGGIFRSPLGTTNVDLNGSVVANNLALNGGIGNDIRIDDSGNPGAVNLTDSAVSDSVGFTAGALTGFSLNGGVILLGPLASNGGPNQTHLPAPGSVLRNATTGAYIAPTIDQRGVTRPIGAAVDIGAVESDGTTPVGILTPTADITTVGGTNVQVKVTYYDTDLNVGSIDSDDLVVTGPAGTLAFAGVVTAPVAGGTEATYTFSAPGGTWDNADGGVYSIALQAGKVTDSTLQSVAAANLGAFKVQLARNYVVTTTNNAGAGSLRQAILDSNQIQDPSGAVDTISFSPGVFGTAQTITLNTGEVNIADSVAIQGTGTKNLTISTGGRNRHFLIYSPGQATVTVTDLTMADGKITGTNANGDIGGSIFSQDETLNFSRIAFINNYSGTNGGVFNYNNAATVANFTDSLFFNNYSGGSGGAIRIPGIGTVNIINSTLTGNTGSAGGGAISNNGGTLNMHFTTVTNNRVINGGGFGGGLRQIAGFATISNSIFASNIAPGGGPDISDAVAVTADYTIVANGAGMTLTTGTELKVGVDPLLNPLADNGGPTMTQSLKAGSPALDGGLNSLAVAFDQRGQNRTYDNPLITNAPGGDGTDIGAYEAQAASAAKVTSIVINNGAAQRSRVTTLKVNFDSAVTIANPANAFTLNRVTPSAGSVTLNTVLDGSGLFATITFTGGLVDGAPGNYSIQDGRYTLTIVPAEFGGAGVDGNSGVLTGNNYNSTPYVNGTTPATGIFRLFGDASGNGKVESDDFLAFRLAFLSSNDAFDFDGNGQVASPDFLSFRLNFLKQVV